MYNYKYEVSVLLVEFIELKNGCSHIDNEQNEGKAIDSVINARKNRCPKKSASARVGALPVAVH